MLPVTPPMDSLATNPQPLQIASQRQLSAAKEINQPASQSEDARLHLSLSGDNLLSSGELALETLFPVYQAEDQTLFVQGRVGKRRAQTSLNLGVGQRWLMNQEWLLGYNLFYDTLWQQGHYSRAGVGLEARQEYLGMAINGYYPVSCWRKLEKSSFYSQRPARGMDVILHANLPAYPQLGASIKGEHYWDKNVQLSDQSHSPSAVTLGVNYTPISLVSAGYHYQIGKKGFKNQYQVHLTLNYRLGIPLAQQLDSSQVAQFRSLSSRRLEPVQRTNQLVLARRLEPKANKLQALVNAGLIPGIHSGTNIDENLTLSDEIMRALQRCSNFTPEVVEALEDLITMGRWNNRAGEITPELLVLTESWPNDTRLIIRSQHGDEPHGQGSQVVELENVGNHYEPIINGVSISVGTEGDCFYSAVLRALGRGDNEENIRQLRRDVALKLTENPVLHGGTGFAVAAWDTLR